MLVADTGMESPMPDGSPVVDKYNWEKLGLPTLDDWGDDRMDEFEEGSVSIVCPRS